MADARDVEKEWCIGIDLGGTFIKFVALDEQMTPGEVLQLPTPDGGPDSVVEQMAAGAEALICDGGIDRERIRAVGIGSPGPISISSGTIISLPNIPGLDGCPIRDLVSRRLGLPAVLENDANAAAYGEYVCGAGKEARDMVMLTLGTGLGSGIIIDGRVLHGSHEIGAEIGHMIVQPDGEQCGCGQRGCLERYSSATYMAEYATRLIREQGRKSSLSGKLADGGSIDAADISAARAADDELATEVWARTVGYLAIGCVNICRIFDPDEIVLAGGLINAGEALMSPLVAEIDRLNWDLVERKTSVVLASLGSDAGAIGAAGVARSDGGVNDE